MAIAAPPKTYINLIRCMKKKQVKTVVGFVLDKSGSMSSCKRSTVSGFNEYIQTLKKENKRGSCKFNLTLFDTVIYQKNINTELHDIKELTPKAYDPNGGTALYDAAVETIEMIKDRIDEEKEKPAVLIAIMTDGEENSSKLHNEKCLKDLIHKLEHEGNWTFVFMGANQDSYQNASKIGISRGNTMNWNSEGMSFAMASFGEQSSNYLRSASLGDQVQTKNFFDTGGKEDAS